MSSPVSPKHLKTKVHSPYSTPVLNASDMTQEARDYFGCSSSDDEIEAPPAHIRPPPQQGFAPHPRIAPPPPPSYVQATTAVRRASFSEPRTQTRTSTPDSEFVSTPPPEAAGAHHRELIGKLEFIQPPPLSAADTPTPSFPCYRLFLGQIRFETTHAEVRWLVQFLCGVRALKVESRGIGCFLAYFQSPQDVQEVQKLHKRVLFDHTGVWFARDNKQADILSQYVATKLSRIGRGFRLPKDMMVVEEEKLTRPLPIPPSPPQYAPYAFQHYTPSYDHPHQSSSYDSAVY